MLSPNESRLITEKYKGLEYINLPITLADNSFSLLYYNSTFSRLFQQMNEVFPARDFNALFQNFSEKIEVLNKAGLSSGHLQNFIIPSVQLRNAERFFDLHVSKFSPELDHLEGFSVTCVEVTEREKEISELSEAADYYDTYLAHTISGVIIHRDGIFVYTNPQAKLLLGIRENEPLSALSFYSFFTQESKEKLLQHEKKISEGSNGTSQVEYQIQRADGSLIDVEIFTYNVSHKNNSAFACTITDITQRKKTEKKLSDSRQQYYSLVENVKEVFFQIDKDERFTFLNTAWQELTGLAADHTIGKLFSEFLYHPDTTQSVYALMLRQIRLGSYRNELEVILRIKPGIEKYVELRFQAVFDDSMNVAGMLGVIEDIHAKKQAQTEVKKIEEVQKLHNKILLRLAKSQTIYDSDLSKSLQLIAKTCTEALNVSRVNIWQFSNQYSNLSCMLSYDQATSEFLQQKDLSSEVCKLYFSHLLTEKIIDSSDISGDYRLAELKEQYYVPNNIKSTLQVLILNENNPWGVLCFEVIGSNRVWAPEEQSFAKSASEFVSIAIHAVQKSESEKEAGRRDELYRTLIEQANDAIYLIDTNDKLWEVNDSACTLMGYSREELIGMEVKQLFPKRFLKPGISVLDKVRQYKRYTSERILLHKNGEEIITEISSILLPDGRIQGIARNITDRKLQERALKESETRLELALKGAELGTWDFFIQEDKIFHNKRWGELLGYNFEMTVMNEQFMDKFVHPDDVQLFYDAFQKHLKGITPYYEVVIRMLASNGEYKWIQDKGKIVEWDVHGNPVRASGIHQDVSAIKTFEKEIQQQKNYLRQIIDAIPNPVYVKNANDEFVIVNNALATFLGVTEKSLLQHKSSPKDNFTKQLRIMFEKDNEIFLSKKAVLIAEQEFPADETHEKRWLQSIKVPLLDSEGNASEILSVSTDISELKRKEHELAQLNEGLELKASDRTAMLEIANKELETFNYSVSHDLRTPLRTIDIFAYFLEKNYKEKLDKEGIENIHQIRQSIIKMSSLIDNLVIYSKMGRQEVMLRRLNVEEIIRDVIEEIKKAEDIANIQFNITHLPLIYADAGMLRIALFNLLSNAIKFSRTRPLPLIECFGYVDEDSTTLSIRDNGVGFSLELKEKLFKPFKRLHSEEYTEGAGVGLAIVEKIIKRHNGQVWAESEENKGTTFYIKLPGK